MAKVSTEEVTSLEDSKEDSWNPVELRGNLTDRPEFKVTIMDSEGLTYPTHSKMENTELEGLILQLTDQVKCQKELIDLVDLRVPLMDSVRNTELVEY